MHLIGIDIGTSSICGVVYNVLDKQLKSVTKINDTAIESPYSYEKTQHPSAIIDIVESIVDEFTAHYSDIQGIGITGQMHGILYVDSEGNAVSPLYTWQDGRGNLPYKNDKTYTDYLSEKTGYTLATGFGLVTHFYNMKNGLVPASAVKLCTVMDYAVMRLSGRKTPLTDYSNGASLGFFDVQNLRFDTQALENAGIDVSILPEIGESFALAGHHYRETIPVYSAIGDNQAAFLGSVSNIRSSVHITVGTSSQISIYSEKYVTAESLDTRPFPGGGYILVGAALCGGHSLAVLKAFFENILRFFVGNMADGIDIYKAMSSIPYDGAGEKDLPLVETLFDGTRLEPYKRGCISNISSSNLTVENLICGFLKGITHELYDFYNQIPENIKKEKKLLVGSGNGIKKNPLLCKIVEKQFNCSLTLSPYQEEAALGASSCGIVGGKYAESFFEFFNAPQKDSPL